MMKIMVMFRREMRGSTQCGWVRGRRWFQLPSRVKVVIYFVYFFLALFDFESSKLSRSQFRLHLQLMYHH